MKTFLMALGASGVSGMRVTTKAINPARRIITSLEQMEATGSSEYESEKDLYDKFMCQWKKETAENTECVATTTAEVEAQSATAKEADSKAKTLTQDIAQHKKDREEAEAALASAKTLREKEAGEYAAESSELSTNIASIKKAVVALEKGTAGAALLQTPQKSNLLSLLDTYSFDGMDNFDLQMLTNFLQGTSSMEAGSTGEIVGILKTMGEQMEADLKEVEEEESAAKTAYEELTKAKNAEVQDSTSAIEEKGSREGEAKVKAVEAASAQKSAQTKLEECQSNLAELEISEKETTASFNELSEEWLGEKAAIKEAIQVLTSDEAMAAFGKIGDGAPAAAPAESFLQVSAKHKNSLRASALLKEVAEKNNDSRLGFLAMALKGKKSGFEKIFEMIDNMVNLLDAEQKQEEQTNEKCVADLHANEKEQITLNNEIGTAESKHTKHVGEIEASKGVIAANQKVIVDLDENVAADTEQRKAENALYLQAKSDQLGAQKFLQKAQGIIKKKLGEDKAGKVLLLFQELDKEITQTVSTMDTEENNSQKNYEQNSANAATERKTTSEKIVKEEQVKAELEAKAQNQKTELEDGQASLLSVKEIEAQLHAQCDFLMDNFKVRKESRDNEIEGLKNAKAVLSGADY